jgi:uncharacterized membrane protein YbhN (UPF0104 family)
MEDVRSFVDAAQAFWGHLSAVAWGALALGCLMQVLRLSARVRAWQNIIRAAYPGVRVPYWDVFGAYWAGVAVNAITPARGGDVVKLYIARHRVRATSYPTLASTLVVETLFDFAVASVMLVAAAQLGLLPGLPDLPSLPAFDWSYAVRHPSIAAIVGSLLLAGIVFIVAWASRHVAAFWERVRLGFAVLVDWRVYVNQVVSWQALSWVFRVASVAFFLRAFHIPVTWETVLTVLVVGGLATTLPITPGGVGTQQAVLVFALSGWASRSAVLSFSVGMQLATVAVNVVIGFAAILILLRTVRWRERVETDRLNPAEPAPQPSPPAPRD